MVRRGHRQRVIERVRVCAAVRVVYTHAVRVV